MDIETEDWDVPHELKCQCESSTLSFISFLQGVHSTTLLP